MNLDDLKIWVGAVFEGNKRKDIQTRCQHILDILDSSDSVFGKVIDIMPLLHEIVTIDSKALSVEDRVIYPKNYTGDITAGMQVESLRVYKEKLIVQARSEKPKEEDDLNDWVMVPNSIEKNSVESILPDLSKKRYRSSKVGSLAKKAPFFKVEMQDTPIKKLIIMAEQRDVSALFILAQILDKGEHGYPQDKAAAFYLAKTAILYASIDNYHKIEPFITKVKKDLVSKEPEPLDTSPTLDGQNIKEFYETALSHRNVI